ncbi:MAG: hypothetical protein LBD42_06290 [Desulfovibrio sp.]|nr:hypothetical protein [Desulfovibrio sp.]
MNSHKNAKLTAKGREEMIRRMGANPFNHHQNFLCGLKPLPKGHIALTPP